MQVRLSREQQALWMLAGMQFVHIVDFMVLMPLSPQLMRLFHIDAGQFALLVSAYTFAAAVSGLMVAHWSDRLPRRNLLLWMFSGFTLGTAACALAQGYASLLLARVIAGFFGGVVSGLVQAYVADLLPPERRGWGMGLVMSAFSIAAVAGVPLGIWLGAHWGWRSTFTMIVVLSLAMGILAHRALPPVPQQRSKEGIWPTLQIRRHHQMFVFTLCLVMAGFTVIPHISPFLVQNLGLPEAELAYVYLTGGAATFFSGRWIGRMADKYGKFKVFAWVALGSTAPILALTQLESHAIGLILFATIPFMVLVSGRFVAAMAFLSLSVAPQHRGRFMVLNTAVQQLGSGLAALLSGLMLSGGAHGPLLGYTHVGWLAAGMTVLAVLMAARLQRQNLNV
jgi:predicted MFS family arabinose efflux permease